MTSWIIIQADTKEEKFQHLGDLRQNTNFSVTNNLRDFVAAKCNVDFVERGASSSGGSSSAAQLALNANPQEPKVYHRVIEISEEDWHPVPPADLIKNERTNTAEIVPETAAETEEAEMEDIESPAKNTRKRGPAIKKVVKKSENACKECEEKFSARITNLHASNHAIKHTSLSRYRCDIGNCEYRANNVMTLRAHFKNEHSRIVKKGAFRSALSESEEVELAEKTVECFPNCDGAKKHLLLLKSKK